MVALDLEDSYNRVDFKIHEDWPIHNPLDRHRSLKEESGTASGILDVEHHDIQPLASCATMSQKILVITIRHWYSLLLISVLAYLLCLLPKWTDWRSSKMNP